MNVELNSTLFLASLVAMFIYQFSIFSYSSKILIGGTKNKWVYMGLALLNTALFTFSLYVQLDLYLIIVAFMIVLIIEFKLISKTDFVQVFCGASIFVLHISALITPCIIIASSMVNIAPEEIFGNTVYGYIIVIITCVSLSLAHELVKKHIDNTSIQRVTVKSKHSIILLGSIVLIVILQINHIATMMSENFYPEQIILSLAISLASLLTFYLFFLYAINLIDASRYKRYSDKVIGEQQTISKQKETLITKIERDDLTGVFNRRYIMDELERMCEEETDSFNVLFVDINALKYTNDTYGHKAGDRLILKITHAILTTVRENDIVGRIGGDEFLVVMPNVQDDDCSVVIERITQGIEQQNETDEILISASIGSIYVDEEVKKQGVSHILSVADENMRKSKALFYNKKEGGTV